MAQKEPIRNFVLHDRHGHEIDFSSLSVVKDVHMEFIPGVGEPHASSRYENGELYIQFVNIDGDGVADITYEQSTADGGTNTITITLESGRVFTFPILNGRRGNGIDHVEVTESSEDGGSNIVTIYFTDEGVEPVSFTIKNGSKGDKGDTGAKGNPGDCAVYDRESQDAPDFVMAQITGNSTTKSMTQKAVTEALGSQNIADWDDLDAGKISDVKLTDDGIVDTKDKGNVYVVTVEDGDFVKIEASRTPTTPPSANNTVVAIFDSTPSVGDEAADVLDVKAATTDGLYSSKIAITRSGVLAVYYYGVSAECTIYKGVTYNEQTSSESQTALTTATEVASTVANIIGGVEEELNPSSTPGMHITVNGERKSITGFSLTEPIQVSEGDIVTYKANGGSGGTNSLIAFALTDDPGDECTSVQADRDGLKTRTYTVIEDGYIYISFYTSDDLELSIKRSGLQGKVERLEDNVSTYESDGTISLGENPLAHIITYPSRARTFKSYGVIGGSFETSYINAYQNGSPVTPYDAGYEWPTLFGKVNNVEVYNYALPGHSFRYWLKDRDKTSYNQGQPPLFPGHNLPWVDDNHEPECFIVNLSSNDISDGGEIGDVTALDVVNIDYTDSINYPPTSMNFEQAAAAVLQLVRRKSPDCYIFVANMRGKNSSDRIDALNDALAYVANLFDKCYLLDITRYGMNWDTDAANKYVTGNASSHPSRLGHIYLADQFNTYIDWYIGKHPEQFLDASYINTDYTRTNE